MLLLYLGIEVIRLFFGTKGNLCQQKMPLGISVALTFPSAMMASYYLLLQTYVLRLEAIMNGILLFFCGSELLLEYGQDLKYKNFSLQLRLTPHKYAYGTVACTCEKRGSHWPGKVVRLFLSIDIWVSSPQKASGHDWLDQDCQPQRLFYTPF
ncbi:transmembrane protein 216 isoform X1 [Ictidomys tridecemlineatus]